MKKDKNLTYIHLVYDRDFHQIISNIVNSQLINFLTNTKKAHVNRLVIYGLI